MNRIITILVTIFILLLAYIWISHVWGSEKNRHPRQIVDATEMDAGKDLLAEEDTAFTQTMTTPEEDEPIHDFEFDTERKSNPANTTAESKPAEKPAEVKKDPVVTKTPVQESKPEPKAETSKPKTETKPKTTPVETKPVSTPVTVSSNAADGKHLVIAGNFSQLDNAQQRVRELKKAGFNEAEVVHFDLSEYHTVCAGRFGDVNEARKVARKLKDYHKIDAYVRIGG